MLIVEIAVDPIGTGSPSVGDYIRRVVEVVRRRLSILFSLRRGLKHWVGPMGTSIFQSSFH